MKTRRKFTFHSSSVILASPLRKRFVKQPLRLPSTHPTTFNPFSTTVFPVSLRFMYW